MGRWRRVIECAVVWAVTPVAVVAIGALPIDDAMRSFLLPLVLFLIVWPIVAIGSIVLASIRGVLDLWVPAFFAAIVVASVLSLVTTREWIPMHALFEASDFVHFICSKPQYDREIAAMASGLPHVRVFVWEIDPIGGDGIAYDDDAHLLGAKGRALDDLLREAGRRDGSFLQEICFVRPLWSHYYYVTFGCS